GWLGRGPGGTVGVGLVYGGAALLGLAWLHLGRRVRQARTDPAVAGTSVPELLRTLAWWAAPLLVAVPLASRDLYSYAAPAQITHAGLDPYSVGAQASPRAFPDGGGYLWQGHPGAERPPFPDPRAAGGDAPPRPRGADRSGDAAGRGGRAAGHRAVPAAAGHRLRGRPAAGRLAGPAEPAGAHPLHRRRAQRLGD